jgi:hypothetical protein
MCKEFDFYYKRTGPPSKQGNSEEGPQVCNFLNFENHLQEFDKILVENTKITANRSAWEYLETILENEPVVVYLDEYFLPYHRRFKNEHFCHFSIIYDLNMANRSVKLIDHDLGASINFYERTLSLHDFLCAFQSADNMFLEFKFPKEPIIYDFSTIRDILARNVGLMSNNKETNSLYMGTKGIKVFATDLVLWLTNYDDEKLINVMDSLLDPIYYVAAQRKWHSVFLLAAADLIDASRFEDISNSIDDISQNWMIVKNMFFKGIRKDPHEMIPRISKRLLTIADCEERVIEEISIIIGN